MSEIDLTIKLKMGPTTINYKAPEGAQLYWTDEANFIQKVMDLMKFIGTEDDVPEDPNPRQQEIAYGSPDAFGAPIVTYSEPEEFDSLAASSKVFEYDDDRTDAFYDDDMDEGSMDSPQGEVVGRVTGVKEVRAS
jgi:hypothetical protein